MSELDLRSFTDHGLKEAINVSPDILKFHIAERPGRVRSYELEPGGRTLVEEGYFKRRDNGNGDVIPSVIDRKTQRCLLGRVNFKIPERLVLLDSDEGQAFVALQEAKPVPRETRSTVAEVETVAATPARKPAKAKKPKAKKAAKAAKPERDPFEV
jgi:hypothetical protein